MITKLLTSDFYKVLWYAVKHTVGCITIKHIKKLLNKEAFLIDVWHCFRGYFIEYAVYNYSDILDPYTVKEFKWRVAVMNTRCLEQGTCIGCGCTVTALQGALKSCDNRCYPSWFGTKLFKELFETEPEIGQLLTSYYSKKNI